MTVILSVVLYLQVLFNSTMKEIINVKHTPNARKNSMRYPYHQPFRLCHFKFRYAATKGSIKISFLFLCSSAQFSKDFAELALNFSLSISIALKSNLMVRSSDSKSSLSTWTPSRKILISIGSLPE